MGKFKSFIILLVMVTLSSTSVYAHSGRTDSRGGHTNHSTGRYHYHNSGSSTTSIETTNISDLYTTPYIWVDLYDKPIVINGVTIKNSSVYESNPIYIYNDIVYLPLSKQILEILGLSQTIENNTLTLNTKGSYSINLSTTKSYPSYRSKTLLFKSDYDIILNGNIVDNEEEEFPFTTELGITYLPLTTYNIEHRLLMDYSNDNGNIEISNKNALSIDNLNELLIHYVIDDDLENVKIVLEKGADPNLVFNSETLSIPVVAISSNDEIIEVLIQYGADVNKKMQVIIDNQKVELTLVELKIILKEFDVVKVYLNYGINKNTIMSNGQTLMNYLITLRNSTESIEEMTAYNSCVSILKQKSN